MLEYIYVSTLYKLRPRPYIALTRPWRWQLPVTQPNPVNGSIAIIRNRQLQIIECNDGKLTTRVLRLPPEVIPVSVVTLEAFSITIQSEAGTYHEIIFPTGTVKSTSIREYVPGPDKIRCESMGYRVRFNGRPQFLCCNRLHRIKTDRYWMYFPRCCRSGKKRWLNLRNPEPMVLVEQSLALTLFLGESGTYYHYFAGCLTPLP